MCLTALKKKSSNEKYIEGTTSTPENHMKQDLCIKIIHLGFNVSLFFIIRNYLVETNENICIFKWYFAF